MSTIARSTYMLLPACVYVCVWQCACVWSVAASGGLGSAQQAQQQLPPPSPTTHTHAPSQRTQVLDGTVGAAAVVGHAEHRQQRGAHIARLTAGGRVRRARLRAILNQACRHCHQALRG